MSYHRSVLFHVLIEREPGSQEPAVLEWAPLDMNIHREFAPDQRNDMVKVFAEAIAEELSHQAILRILPDGLSVALLRVWDSRDYWGEHDEGSDLCALMPTSSRKLRGTYDALRTHQEEKAYELVQHQLKMADEWFKEAPEPDPNVRNVEYRPGLCRACGGTGRREHFFVGSEGCPACQTPTEAAR